MDSKNQYDLSKNYKYFKFLANKYWNKNAVEEEVIREEKFPLVDIQTTITWLKINQFLGEYQVKTLLDAGAGTGRYSIPMARFGFEVTHLDISDDMLKFVENLCEKEEIPNINFQSGSITDMSFFSDRQFDLSFCFDAPISYCYPYQQIAIKELCRVTDKLLMLMVSNRNGVIPFMIDFDLSGDYLPPGYEGELEPFYITKKIMENGVESWPEEIDTFLKASKKEAPLDYSFKIDELKEMVEAEGFDILEIGGPGALARSIKRENLEKIRNDERLFNEFIKFSLEYDFDKYNAGLGAVNILLIAKRK